MRMPPINIPKWIVAAAKLKGEGFNRIALLGNHYLAKIYADGCSSMGIEFIWLRDTKCIFDTFEQMEHVCLLIIFGEGSAAHLREGSSVLEFKLLGLPIVEVVTPSRAATSLTVSVPSCNSTRATSRSAELSRFGRPPSRPLARAAIRPANVLSRIIDRSNSASAPKMWNTSFPPEVVVSIASVKERNPILRLSRSSNVAIS